MSRMDDAGFEPSGADDVLAEARRLRENVARDPSAVSPTFSPLIVRNLDQLIALAESLMAERAQFQSRLHRRPAATFADTLPPAKSWHEEAAG